MNLLRRFLATLDELVGAIKDLEMELRDVHTAIERLRTGDRRDEGG